MDNKPKPFLSNKNPLGLQLIADSFREDLLLQGAYSMEKELNFFGKPNLLNK